MDEEEEEELSEATADCYEADRCQNRALSGLGMLLNAKEPSHDSGGPSSSIVSHRMLGCAMLSERWNNLLAPIFESLTGKKMAASLDAACSDRRLLSPQKWDIFHFLRYTEGPEKVELLVVCPGPADGNGGQYNGIGFGSSRRSPFGGHVTVLEKEIGHSLDHTMVHWSRQGVVLLPTKLAWVSGARINYQPFLTQLVQSILQSRADLPVWFCGKDALALTRQLSDASADRNVLRIYTSGLDEIEGSDVFDKINRHRQGCGKAAIQWR